MKSEPATYAITDLARDRRTAWEGVRNYRARNFLRAMRRGDRAFFYHSGCPLLAVVGEVEIVHAAYPDPAQFDPKSDYHDPGSRPDAPRWDAVDVRFVRHFEPVVTREAMKRVPALRGMLLFRHSRLSVVPVTAAERRAILALAG